MRLDIYFHPAQIRRKNRPIVTYYGLPLARGSNPALVHWHPQTPVISFQISPLGTHWAFLEE